MMVDLLRHGATDREGYLDGRMDFPLSNEGWAQFRRQTAQGTWSRIVASPLRRAREAAEALAQDKGLALRLDPDWAEMDFGVWDGRLRTEIAASPAQKRALDAFMSDPSVHPAPGGEMWADVEARIARALDCLLTEDPSGPVLVVTHAGPMRLAMSIACGFAFDALWAVRIGYATRIRLQLGKDAGVGSNGRPWGEIVEIAQP